MNSFSHQSLPRAGSGFTLYPGFEGKEGISGSLLLGVTALSEVTPLLKSQVWEEKLW